MPDCEHSSEGYITTQRDADGEAYKAWVCGDCGAAIPLSDLPVTPTTNAPRKLKWEDRDHTDVDWTDC